MHELANSNENNYFTKGVEHTSDITNNITRHNHNNCEHNVIKKVNKHIKHNNNYDAGINYHLIKRIVITFTMICQNLE